MKRLARTGAHSFLLLVAACGGDTGHVQPAPTAARAVPARAVPAARVTPDPAPDAGQPGGVFGTLSGDGDLSSGLSGGEDSVLTDEEENYLRGELGGGAQVAAPPATGTATAPRRVPVVTLGALEVRDAAALDPAIIRRYLRRKVPAIRLCYARALTAQPTLAGTVVAELSIDRAGDLASVSVSGLGDEPTEACIAARLKELALPRPRHDATVAVRCQLRFAHAP